MNETGYTSWKSASGEIEGFTFVHSPWVNRTGSDIQPRSLVSQRWEEGLLNRILTGYRPVLQFAQQG